MPKRILTSIYLPHAPERVWTVLTDFEHYAAWNPLNLEAKGEARVGAKVAMRFLNPAKPGATIHQTVTITRAERARLFAWRLTEEQIETQFVPDYEACNRALAARLEAPENVVPLRVRRA